MFDRTLRIGGVSVEPQVRMLSELEDVLFDRSCIDAGDAELYYMYRDIYLSKRDRDSLLDLGLRYDITVIPPRMLGEEYVKTAGHYHPPVPGTEITYPELYEVLDGQAHFLLQKPENWESVSDVVLIEAKKSDKVLIPPGYGHITINPSKKVLRIANLVSREFESIYEPMRRMGGAAYFELRSGFIENKRYSKLVPLRRRKSVSKRSLLRGREIYGLLREDSPVLKYLVKPQLYLKGFEEIIGK